MNIRIGPELKRDLDKATEAIGKVFHIKDYNDTSARYGEGFIRYVEVELKGENFHPLMDDDE